jgi:hypothetical protein
MQNQEPPQRRWSRRLIVATSGCLFSAVFVAIQIPAVREAVGAAKTIYRFINSTVPSLGVAAIWIGFVLVVGGVVAAWRFHRVLKEGTTKMVAVGSAVLVMAVGGLVAVVSTLSQPGPPSSTAPPSYVASVGRHHRSPRHHHHHTPANRPSSGGSKATGTPSPAPPNPTPAPAPAPSPQPSGGGSSSSGGSGGNGNNVTVNKNHSQTATSGNAEGPGATSGPATNNNNEGPVNISIG